jgi:hypothetical protein
MELALYGKATKYPEEFCETLKEKIVELELYRWNSRLLTRK